MWPTYSQTTRPTILTTTGLKTFCKKKQCEIPNGPVFNFGQIKHYRIHFYSVPFRSGWWGITWCSVAVTVFGAGAGHGRGPSGPGWVLAFMRSSYLLLLCGTGTTLWHSLHTTSLWSTSLSLDLKDEALIPCETLGPHLQMLLYFLFPTWPLTLSWINCGCRAFAAAIKFAGLLFRRLNEVLTFFIPWWLDDWRGFVF